MLLVKVLKTLFLDYWGIRNINIEGILHEKLN